MLEMDHRLDHTACRLGPTRELLRHLGEFRTVADPRGGVDAAVLDEADDAGKICGQGVATGQQRHLAFMKIRVIEAHLSLI